jgi:hypothetical protein
LQKSKLFYQKIQKISRKKVGTQKILQDLPKAYTAQGKQAIKKSLADRTGSSSTNFAKQN